MRLCERTNQIAIAYDGLGFGRSSPRSEPLPFDLISGESTTCIPAILHDFNLNKFIVFGHSVGGGMAVICAAKFNSRCMGVIAESAQAFIEKKPGPGL